MRPSGRGVPCKSLAHLAPGVFYPRPSRSGKWTYVFFIDFIGHHRDPLIKDVLEKLAQEAVALKVLGSYPKAVL